MSEYFLGSPFCQEVLFLGNLSVFIGLFGRQSWCFISIHEHGRFTVFYHLWGHVLCSGMAVRSVSLSITCRMTARYWCLQWDLTDYLEKQVSNFLELHFNKKDFIAYHKYVKSQVGCLRKIIPFLFSCYCSYSV